MNRTPSVEVVLRDYLADDGARAPDYLLDLVADRIRLQPPRRSWPFRWRTTMTTFRFAGLAAALLALIIGGLLLIGRAPTPVVEPAPSASPASSAPIATPAASATSNVVTESSPPLSFDVSKFKVPFTVTFVDGWRGEPGDMTTTTMHFVNDFRSELSVWSLADTRVKKPSTSPATYAEMQPWPADIHAWLASLPDVSVSDPIQTTVGGRPATIVDFSRTKFPNGLTFEGQAGFNIWCSIPHGASCEMAVAPDRERLVEVRTGKNSGLIAVLPFASHQSFDRAAALIDELLATLTFD